MIRLKHRHSGKYQHMLKAEGIPPIDYGYLIPSHDYIDKFQNMPPRASWCKKR